MRDKNLGRFRDYKNISNLYFFYSGEIQQSKHNGLRFLFISFISKDKNINKME